MREILAYQPRGTGTRIAEALTFINKVLPNRSVVFTVSDFLDPDFEKALKHTARRHDCVGVRLSDPRESELPSLGLIELADGETGTRLLVDSSDPRVRELYHQRAQTRRETVSRVFKKCQVDMIDISTGRSYLEPLQRFFIKRERRIR